MFSIAIAMTSTILFADAPTTVGKVSPEPVVLNMTRSVVSLPEPSDFKTFRWQRPTEVHFVLLRGCGGGGGGAGGSGSSDGSANFVGYGGEGGEGAAVTTMLVGPLNSVSYEITIGAGGTGGVANSSAQSGTETSFVGTDASASFPGARGGKAGGLLQSGTPENVPDRGDCAKDVRKPGGSHPASSYAPGGNPGTSVCTYYGPGSPGGGGGGGLGRGGDGGNFESGIYGNTTKEGAAKIRERSLAGVGGACAGGGGGPGGEYTSNGFVGANGGNGSLTIIPIIDTQRLFDEIDRITTPKASSN